MENRKWLIAGIVTGVLALLLLAGLAGYAIAEDRGMTARLMVLGVLDMILGITSLKLLGDAASMARMDRYCSRYVEGVGDTVDRLASALPQKDNVRRIS